jgi:secreted PhoX family phosphatase
MAPSRRSLLGSTAAGVGLVAAATATGGLVSPAAADTSPRRRPRVPGPLVDDPAGLLALPAGFSYKLVAVAGETALVTGEKPPDRADGTGAFPWRDRIRLVQNHEQGPGAALPVPQIAGTVYDAAALGGGCTVIEVSRSADRIAEWVGLSGTISNCAGGVTPWNTWLTCEETDIKAGAVSAGATLAEDHGWIFEVAPAEPRYQRPVPIRAWGRYPHEAVVVEPSRRRVFRCPTGSPAPPRPASSSPPTRSPAARSSKAHGATTTASSSTPPTRTPATSPPGPCCTTGRSGITTTRPARSR